MIGLVIVSHSRQLADGLKRMADAMAQNGAPIAAAGGMDEPDDPLGTDALRIQQAIVDMLACEPAPEGVLVFADLGSAKLNADMAIDLLEEDQQQKVRFCDAPLVEGVLSAAISSAGGATLEQVMSEAQSAWEPPQALVPATAPTGAAQLSPHGPQAVIGEYIIGNPLGLHARPAALLVGMINHHQSDVRIRNLDTNSPFVNARSINKVVTLEILQGHHILVSAEGPDAAAVQQSIADLVRQGFGEATPGEVVEPGAPKKAPPAARPAPASTQPPASGPQLSGVAISPGLAVAPAHRLHGNLPPAPTTTVADPQAELTRFEEALTQVRGELERIITDSRATVGLYESRIFEAQRLHLEDPELTDAVRAGIRDHALNAEAAWQQTVDAIVAQYHALEDPVLRARGDDLADVGKRVRLALRGESSGVAALDAPVILCLDQLRPSDILTLDLKQVQGLCVEAGSKTSHAGILASGLGIPVVFGLGAGLASVVEGREILIDGSAGTVDLDPDEATLAQARERRTAWQERVARATAARHQPAITRDGERRRVAANMRGPQELDAILDSGADEVGLFRTEFLFMNRIEAPDEEEQFLIYCQAAERMEERGLTIRTMDIGADKPIAYLNREREANPNLGWRGLRFCLDNPQLFQTQLRAILRASAFGAIRIMFPMVSTVEEMRAARMAVENAQRSLDMDGMDYDHDVPVGLMIEVPSATEIAPQLAELADFFSIGTNDLTQYLLAADRGNPRVQHLVDPLHPVVLRAIERTIRAGRQAGKWVGVCGEMGGNRLAMPILLGLGLEEFSMNPQRVPEFKLDFTELDAGRCQTLAQEVLQFATGTEVRERVEAFLAG